VHDRGQGAAEYNAASGNRASKQLHAAAGMLGETRGHKDGMAKGVHFTDSSGEEYFQPAGAVVLASWTLNNVRLLYLSRIGRPYDPGLVLER